MNNTFIIKYIKDTSKKYRHFVLIFFWFSLPLVGVTQATLPLSKALTLVENTNLELQIEKRMVEYQNALVHTAYDIPATEFNANVGQINSQLFDTEFSVNQSFALPKVYKNGKKWLQKQVEIQKSDYAINYKNVQKLLEEFYVDYAYYSYIKQILLRQDSLLNLVSERTSLKVEKGETDRLEILAAQQQQTQNTLQIKNVERELHQLNLQIWRILQLDSGELPEILPLENLNVENNISFPKIDQHPIVQKAQNELEAAKAAEMYQKSLMLPTFSLGYSNISFNGASDEQKVFSAKDRFHIGQIGMQIPLYRSALQSKVKAIKMMEDIHSERVAMETKSLQSASMIYLENRKNMMSSIDIFRSDQLTASEAAIQLIKQKYIAGDIDFMEFTILSNNFINARKDYVELLRAFHLNEINLKYLQK